LRCTGRGVLACELSDPLAHHRLGGILTLTEATTWHSSAAALGLRLGAGVKNFTSLALLEAMADYLRRPNRHDAIAAASRALTTRVHTIKNFADDITAFWSDVIRR
jgi:hypothetical protein